MKSNLNELIARSGLRKGFLAEKLQISPQQFSKWIKGEVYPSADQLFYLAKILNCKVDEMYTVSKEWKLFD